MSWRELYPLVVANVLRDVMARCGKAAVLFTLKLVRNIFGFSETAGYLSDSVPISKSFIQILHPQQQI